MKRLLPILFTLACSTSVSAPNVPADRPILGWTGNSAVDSNKAVLPQGFTVPDQHACAADPTRQYLGEVFDHGIDDVQVLWHWAPVVAPAQQPTLTQPEFSLAGQVVAANDSGDDVLTDHPFGFDVNVDVSPDAPFTFLPFEANHSTYLHTEIEMRTFPRTALGYSPQAGDRVLQRGVWVLDCGHPPYGAEMHPPSFMSYARAADAKTTIASALFAPYRSSLLFSPDEGQATALLNTARFNNGLPFAKSFVQVVQTAVLSGAQRLQTHAMMIPNKFDSLDFLVCAPLPRPAGATLSASWRFAARTGVKIAATQLDSSGCVRFVATMDSTYTPKPLVFKTAEWPWKDLSDAASSQMGQPIDVRQAIIDALARQGFNASNTPALQDANAPLVDAYDELVPRSDASLDSPTQIATAADDQPFPFYGRVRVAWKP